MIKIGITGQDGFIGRHLYNFLGTKAEEFERINFERNYFDNEKQLKTFVSTCDVIVHIAAVNRHKDQQVIYDTNVNLVNKLINACEKTKSNPKIIFSSSTQEEHDNLYGRSKRDGRKELEHWATQENGQITSFIIPNVYGPFSKPFYNSFIATFCYQIINNESAVIDNDSIVNLIFINELSEVFYHEIVAKDIKPVKIIQVPHTATEKVSKVLQMLSIFKQDYIENGKIPNLNDDFTLNLFNTFTSFLPKNYFPKKFVQHTDKRGIFVEIMRSNSTGQCSYSTTVPGITRGNHYHTRKVERFAVIKGKARIQLRKINTDEVFNYELNGSEPAYVDIPIWHAHNITNIGSTELITIFWINEAYNTNDTDTFFEEV